MRPSDSRVRLRVISTRPSSLILVTLALALSCLSDSSNDRITFSRLDSLSMSMKSTMIMPPRLRSRSWSATSLHASRLVLVNFPKPTVDSRQPGASRNAVRVLVTETGFLGSHILDGSFSAGHGWQALVRTFLQRSNVEIVRGDVTEPASLTAAMAGCDAVIHSAAVLTFRFRDAAHQREVNVQGTRNVVEAARAAGVKRLVFTSSVAALGRPNGKAADRHPLRLAGGAGAGDSATPGDGPPARNLETISLNPALVLGPGERYRHSLPLLRLAQVGPVAARCRGRHDLVRCARCGFGPCRGALARRTRRALRPRWSPASLSELAAELAAATGGRPARAEIPSSLVRFGALPLVVAEKLGVPMPYSPLYALYLTLRSFYKSDRAVAELGYQMRPAAETIGDAATSYRAEDCSSGRR